jgi:2-polyprenyl-6-methoxyphenol hydroxylase-like FAD-dependent oxidoreductase
MALEDAMYLAKLLRDAGATYERAFDQFENDRKERVEKIVAEGRARARDKEIVNWFQARLRDIMIMVFVRLYGEKSQRWKLDYKIDWDDLA